MDTTMKITFEAEVVEDHETAMVVMLKTGFGEPKVMTTKDKVLVDSPDKGRALYEEVNAYMNPTAQRMSSREGLRKALAAYREVAS